MRLIFASNVSRPILHLDALLAVAHHYSVRHDYVNFSHLKLKHLETLFSISNLKSDVTFQVDTFSYVKLFHPTLFAKVMAILPKNINFLQNDLKFILVMVPNKYITTHNYILKEFKN
jgi:hypothetical protein